MRTHNIPSCWRKSKTYPYYAPLPGSIINLNGSNYPCLEQIFIVPKVFEPLKFDCTYNAPDRQNKCCNQPLAQLLPDLDTLLPVGKQSNYHENICRSALEDCLYLKDKVGKTFGPMGQGLIYWVSGPSWSPAWGGEFFERKRGSIAHSHSLSPTHRPDMTEILLHSFTEKFTWFYGEIYMVLRRN